MDKSVPRDANIYKSNVVAEHAYTGEHSGQGEAGGKPDFANPLEYVKYQDGQAADCEGGALESARPHSFGVDGDEGEQRIGEAG